MFDHGFVFALLDWRYEKLTARRWNETHAEDMGIGPPASCGAQRIMKNYFSGGDNGRFYEGLWNEYLSNAQQSR